jgi:hypothetical protein
MVPEVLAYCSQCVATNPVALFKRIRRNEFFHTPQYVIGGACGALIGHGIDWPAAIIITSAAVVAYAFREAS